MKAKKFLVSLLAGAMAISALSVSAFAKEIIEIDNVGKIIAYEEGDYVPAATHGNVSTFSSMTPITFQCSFPSYPNSSILLTNKMVRGINNVVPLYENDNAIRITFSSTPRNSFYMTFFNAETQTIDDVEFGLVQNPSRVFDLIPYGAAPGDLYQIYAAGVSFNISLSGTITTFLN